MFDRVDAGGDGPPHTLGGYRMHRHRATRVMRRSNGSRHFCYRQRWSAGFAALVMVIGIKLDHIGACRNLVACHAHDLVGA